MQLIRTMMKQSTFSFIVNFLLLFCLLYSLFLIYAAFDDSIDLLLGTFLCWLIVFFCIICIDLHLILVPAKKQLSGEKPNQKLNDSQTIILILE